MDKFDVFISYSRADYQDAEKNIIEGNVVSKIKKALDDNKISYWIDEDGIYSGDNFAPVIGRAIKESSVFVFVSSANSNSSQWVQNEVGVANHYRKPIIPIRLDESEYADNIVMYLTVLDFCEYYANQENALKKLVKAIREKLPKIKRIENESNNKDTKYQKELLSSIHNIGDQMLEVSQIAVSKLLNNTDRISYEMRERIEKSESILHEILSCEEESKQKHDGYFNAYLDDSHNRFEKLESLITETSKANINAIERNTESVKEISLFIIKYTDTLYKQLEDTNCLLKQICSKLNSSNLPNEQICYIQHDMGKCASSKVANIFFIIDVSGSMYGKNINVVNNAFRKEIEKYKEHYSVPSNVNVELSVLSYSSDATWQNKTPLNIHEYQWVDLEAFGVTSYGLALSKLNAALSFKDGFFSTSKEYMKPLLVFLTDGQPTDNWKVIYNEITNNIIFNESIKYYISIGIDIDNIIEIPNRSTIFSLNKIEDLGSSLNYIINDYLKNLKPIKECTK